MRIFKGNERGARRARARKSMVFFMAVLLLFSAGCSPRGSDDDDALRDKLLQSVFGGLTQSPAPTLRLPGPSPRGTPATGEGDDSSPSSWAKELAGLWVEVDRFADPESLMILYFTEDGYIYADSEAYYAALGYEADPTDAWTIENGEPQYIDKVSGEAGRMELGADGTLRVEWYGWLYWNFERPETPRASALLLESGYYDLSENIKTAFVMQDEEFSDGDEYATLWINDVVWVDFEDSELIARYGLEDVFADDDVEYYLYSDDSAWRPVRVMPDGGTAFMVVDWEDEWLSTVPIDFESFKEILEHYFDDDYGQNPFLVYYSGEDENGVVFAIGEVYLS